MRIMLRFIIIAISHKLSNGTPLLKVGAKTVTLTLADYLPMDTYTIIFDIHINKGKNEDGS